MSKTHLIEPSIFSLSTSPGELSITVQWEPVVDTYGDRPLILTRLPPFTVTPHLDPDATSYVDEDVEAGQTYLYTLACMDSRGLIANPRSAFGIPLPEVEEPPPPPPPPGGNLFVSPNGSASASGLDSANPTSVARALSIVNPGETVVFLPGVYNSTVPVATGNTVLNVTRSGTAAAKINLLAIAGVSVTNPAGYGIYCKNVSHVIIDGFEVHNCALKGIAARESSPTAPMTGNVIRNCSVHDTTQEGIYLSQWSNGLIEDVAIDTVGLSGVETTGHGIYLANAGSKNVTFRGVDVNLTLASLGCAIHMNGDLSSSAGTDGLISGILIEQCKLFGGQKGVSGDGVTDSIIRNNIIDIQKNGARFGHGIRLYQTDAANGPKNMQIYNNTVRCGTGGSSSAIRLTTEPAPQTAVFNNLTISNDQWYFTGPQLESNLNGANFDLVSYAPNATAQAGGVASVNGVSAPTHDIYNVPRTEPVTIGAIE